MQSWFFASQVIHHCPTGDLPHWDVFTSGDGSEHRISLVVQVNGNSGSFDPSSWSGHNGV